MTDGILQELSNALASAHPKIQKMCEEESDDHEAVAKLFEINDSIHRTIERYKLIKKGDLEGASKIPKGTLGTSGAGVSKGPDNELSLIDFGGPEDSMSGAAPESSAAPASQSKGNALEDDLLGLSMGDSAFGSGGALSLGTGNGLGDLAGPSSAAQPSQTSTPKLPNSAIMSQFSQPAHAPQPPTKANYDPFAALGGSQTPSKPATPVPSIFTQQHQPQQQQQQHKADPFASLNSPARQPSPFQFQQSLKATASPAPPAQQQSASSLLGGQSNGAAAAADDEWTFSSALPDQTNSLTVTNSTIKTVFQVSRPSNADNYITIESAISNNTALPITDLTFQLAVTKVRFLTPSLLVPLNCRFECM